MANQGELRFVIMNGPPKFDLMVALFKKDETVQFTIRLADIPAGTVDLESPTFEKSEVQKPGPQKIFDFIISGVSIEDGSREKWLIHGFYTEPSYPEGREINWTRFEGYYNTRTRTGWLNNASLQKAS